jgi:hypothetical protein
MTKMRTVVATTLLVIVSGVPALVHDVEHRFAQLSDHDREWLRSQHKDHEVPCCSVSDGVESEEDIRGDQYWVRFTYHKVVSVNSRGETVFFGPALNSGWMQVPDDAIIYDPNRPRDIGPIVWWSITINENEPRVQIRCFSPGAKG